MRIFYLTYPDLISIGHAARDQLDNAPADAALPIQQRLSEILFQQPETEWKPGLMNTGLSWTHYRTLLKVERQTARDFYEIEAVKNGWSTRQLARQIDDPTAVLTGNEPEFNVPEGQLIGHHGCVPKLGIVSPPSEHTPCGLYLVQGTHGAC